MARHSAIQMDSRWWRFPSGSLHRDRELGIDWRTLLLPHTGSAYQRGHLMRSAKGLMVALFDTATCKGEVPAIGTVTVWFTLIRRLVHSMAERQIWLFSDLRPDDMLDFLSSMRATDGASPASPRTVRHASRLFMRMWDLRALYAGSLRFDPHAFETEIHQIAARGTSGRWRPVAEEQALQLVRHAIEWIEEFGEHASELIHARCQLQPELRDLPKHHIDQRWKTFNTSMERDPRMMRAREVLSMQQEATTYVINRVIQVTEGACVVAILFLTGMRRSELARLDVDCLQVETTPDGQVDQFLVGIAAKHAGRSKRWVVCDPVPQIINRLGAMYRAVREECGSHALWLRRSGRMSPGGPAEQQAAAWNGEDVARRLRLFALDQLRRKQVDVGGLHPHQARKTFAQFVVLRDKTALGSLAYHFGHVYESVTDGSYVGHDIELARLIGAENRRELARCLTDLLSSSAIGGRAGTALSLQHKEMSEGHAFAGKRAVAGMVERLIDQGVDLAPCNWGYCVYAKTFSACRGDEKGPNPVRRAPDVCATCANFAVTERHRPWWEERVRRDEAFLMRPGLPAQTVAVVRRRMEQASAVLQGLNQCVGSEVKKG
ncbi:hypothetical protein [Ottowia sp.]|uniref:hypothetical protein n=1 Tax=Ottowia sp. TaxID=1898956 RepID=UPI00260C3AE7|nr:hypothetical protein [Ottowia sp.]